METRNCNAVMANGAGNEMALLVDGGVMGQERGTGVGWCSVMGQWGTDSSRGWGEAERPERGPRATCTLLTQKFSHRPPSRPFWAAMRTVSSGPANRRPPRAWHLSAPPRDK